MTKYAELRAALEAGPTPGPWLLDKFHPHITDAAHGSSRVLVCQVAINTRNDEGRKNAVYIAACHPEAIRALLAEMDALRDALWVATEHNALHFGESHNTVIQGRAALAQEQGGSDAQD